MGRRERETGEGERKRDGGRQTDRQTGRQAGRQTEWGGGGWGKGGAGKSHYKWTFTSHITSTVSTISSKISK